MRLEKFLQQYGAEESKRIADRLAVRVRKLLSVRAPLKRSHTGRVYAATRAIPGAPPRYVSGKLYDSVKTYQTKYGARLVVWAPYAKKLEEQGHLYVSIAMKEEGLA